MLWLNIRYLPLIGMKSNDVDAFQFNAVGMIGRGFINLPLSGKSLTSLGPSKHTPGVGALTRSPPWPDDNSGGGITEHLADLEDYPMAAAAYWAAFHNYQENFDGRTQSSRRAASTFGRFSKLALKPRRMFFGYL